MLGIVTSLWREGDPQDPGSPEPYATVRLQEGPEVNATYSGEPPPPLTWVELTQDGLTYHVDGSHDLDSRTVLHDDFTRVPTTAAGTTTIACDTPWVCSISTGGSISQLTGSQLGVALLATGAANGRLAYMTKDDTAFSMDAADALWLSTKVDAAVLTTSMIAYVGFSNVALTDQCCMLFLPSSSANLLGYTVKDSSGTATDLIRAAANEYVDLDIVLAPGSFAAFWVNGDGPYVSTTNIPTSGDSMQPFFYVVTLESASKYVALDYVTVRALNGTIANPASDPLLTS